jgi:hypothetical protein
MQFSLSFDATNVFFLNSLFDPGPTDTYSNSIGATSLSQCTMCDEERTTGQSNASIANASCICRRSLYYQQNIPVPKCVNCPVGADCSASDGLPLSQVIPKLGFYLSTLEKEGVAMTTAEIDALDHFFIDCQLGYKTVNLSQEICLGGQRNKSNMCKTGYTGTLCMTCEKSNYVRSGGLCIECDGGSSMLVAIYPTLGVAAVTFLAVFVCMWRVEQDELEDLMEEAEAEAEAQAEAEDKDTNEKKDTPSELGFKKEEPVMEVGIKKEAVRNWETPTAVAKSGRTKPALGRKRTALDRSKSAHHHDHMARRAAKMSRSIKSAKRAKGMATKQKVVRDVMNQYVFGCCCCWWWCCCCCCC